MGLRLRRQQETVGLVGLIDVFLRDLYVTGVNRNVLYPSWEFERRS